MCDGEDDCGGSEDEVNCTASKCMSTDINHDDPTIYDYSYIAGS